MRIIKGEVRVMTEHVVQNNQVTIAGKVKSELEFSHRVYGEGFYKFDVEVPRLSEAVDILPITVSERLLVDGKIEIGQTVEIEGQFRSYNQYEEGKNRLILTVFALEVKSVNEEEILNNSNQIFLDGFVCKQPVYRMTPFGREITDLLVAVNRPYHKSDYIPCIAWGRNARYGQNLNVGDHLKVWGRIQSREYQKKLKDGNVVSKVAYEISVSKMEINHENNKSDEDSGEQEEKI